MQLTARLKSVEELKKLESFDSIDGQENMFFKNPSLCINRSMFELGLVDLEWSKEYKRFINGDWVYNLEWITDITVSDNKLKLGLEIEGLTLTVRIDKSIILDSSTEDVIYKSHKDKFSIVLGDYSDSYILPNKLYLADYNDMEYTFKTHKKLIKWIRNLINCTENKVELNK